jgi:hypothetical protein
LLKLQIIELKLLEGEDMPKYGRGLNREIVSAVNIGIIDEPFGITEIKKFATSKGWNIPDTYINVTLANAANPSHSIL